MPFVDVVGGVLTKSTKYSIGYDIHSTENKLVLPGSIEKVKTGLIVNMYDCFGLILDKSGLAGDEKITTRGGVIDPDYKGEWLVILVNEGSKPYEVKGGDKIAQVIFFGVPQIQVGGRVVHKEKERTGGFGSTGI